MTDRMSNVEIEDVLSSIRRLVSDELRPMAPLRPAPPRLVLTEALRVDRGVPTAVGAAVPVVSEPDAAVLLPPAEIMPNDPEAGLTDLDVALADLPDDLADDPLAESEPAFSLSDPEERRQDAELASRLAELEVLLDFQGQPFEPESGETGDMPLPGWQAIDGLAVPEAPFLTDEDAEADRAATGMAWTEPAAIPVHGASDAADADDLDDDHLDAAEPGEVIAAATGPGEEDNGYRLLDEAVLRDLIRDVLREELQGVMGQRVTRNLRKMVRTELARTLNARGMT